MRTSARGAGWCRRGERVQPGKEKGQGRGPLRIEGAQKDLERMAGIMQQQLAQHMAQSDMIARKEEGKKAPPQTMQNHVAEGAA